MSRVDLFFFLELYLGFVSSLTCKFWFSVINDDLPPMTSQFDPWYVDVKLRNGQRIAGNARNPCYRLDGVIARTLVIRDFFTNMAFIMTSSL